MALRFFPRNCQLFYSITPHEFINLFTFCSLIKSRTNRKCLATKHHQTLFGWACWTCWSEWANGLKHVWLNTDQAIAISFLEPRVVWSAPCLGADQKTRGHWERDWNSWYKPLSERGTHARIKHVPNKQNIAHQTREKKCFKLFDRMFDGLLDCKTVVFLRTRATVNMRKKGGLERVWKRRGRMGERGSRLRRFAPSENDCFAV